MSGPLLRYTAMRFALFAGCYALVQLTTSIRDAPALLLSLVVSSLASVVLLKTQRDAIATAAEGRKAAKQAERERLRDRLADDGG